MEPDSKMPCSGPGDDDNNMADVEIEANGALTEIAQQLFRLAGGTSTPSQKRVPPTFIKYDPSGDSTMPDSVTARSRLFRLSDTTLDPLDPPKFRRRRFPGPGRPPAVPVMSSPPRPPSRKDQSDWKVPPCISGWKNPNGYTIPLDKRLRASSEENARISANFARLAESLRAVEMKAREEVCMRSAVHKEMRAKLMERRERELRQLAASARAERAADAASAADPPAPPPVSAREEPGDDEKSKAKHGVSDICGSSAGEQLEKVTKTDLQRLSTRAPARAAGKRERPVELDEPEQGDDPFDLDQFMAQVKKGKED